MGDAIAISAHAYPWQPTPETELVEEYDRYDVPLVGRLRQNGADYVFWCVEGVVGDVSLWAYARVSSTDLDELDRAGNFDAAFARVTADKPLVLAVYEEAQGIIGSFSVDRPRSFDSLVDAARSQIRELNRTLGRRTLIA